MTNNKGRLKEPAGVAEPPSIGSDQASKISIRQIVVPTDLTPDGRKAIDYALAMARCFNADLTLVHIYDPSYTYAEAEEVIKSLEMLCSELRREHPASGFTIGVGAPSLQIPEMAKEMHADLMVISMHNYGWLERIMFGSDAKQVIRRTPCPILVVRENERNVVSAT